jgi:transcriptional regulator with XRE-family HTH domain
MSEKEHESDLSYSGLVGSRLRSIRKQKRLSLHDVEAQSDTEFRASVLGAYERGERSISVPRLQRLATFYGVPMAQLLPGTAPDLGVEEPLIDLTEGQAGGPITIDLTSLERLSGPEAEMLRRYLMAVQMQRQDFAGAELTIRGSDLRLLAAILAVDVDAAATRLRTLGVAAPGSA